MAVPNPEELLARLIAEGNEASSKGEVPLDWEQSTDRPSFSRLVAQIPLQEVTFDQLWNGRSGYRAQYYLSPEEGILFNRDILEGLIPAIRRAYDKRPISIALNLIEESLRAPHSKLWIFKEKHAFNQAEPEMLNPQRWVNNNASNGRKAPLPNHFTIDLKGTFIKPDSRELFIDPIKLDRACDLFNRGYA